MIWNPAEFTDLHLPPWLVLLSVDSDSPPHRDVAPSTDPLCLVGTCGCFSSMLGPTRL